MTARPVVGGGLAVVAALALSTAGAAAAVVDAGPRGVTVATLPPCPHGKPVGPHVACTGPRVEHAGGGAGVLTIVVSVVVGLAVAAGAAVVVRRRLALDAVTPRPRRPRRPS